MLLVPAWAFRPPPQASLVIIPAMQLRDAKAKSRRISSSTIPVATPPKGRHGGPDLCRTYHGLRSCALRIDQTIIYNDPAVAPALHNPVNNTTERLVSALYPAAFFVFFLRVPPALVLLRCYFQSSLEFFYITLTYQHCIHPYLRECAYECDPPD